MTLSQQLRECPFCGSRAELREDYNPGYPWSVISLHTNECYLAYSNVNRHRFYATREQAIAAWIRRSPIILAALELAERVDDPAMVERLRRIAASCQTDDRMTTGIALTDAARTIEAQAQEIERLVGERAGDQAEILMGSRESATLRAQLAEAMTLMKDCADDLESEVKDRWGYDERLSHKLERDLAPVIAVRAFLTKHRSSVMDDLIAGDADLTDIKRG